MRIPVFPRVSPCFRLWPGILTTTFFIPLHYTYFFGQVCGFPDVRISALRLGVLCCLWRCRAIPRTTRMLRSAHLGRCVETSFHFSSLVVLANRGVLPLPSSSQDSRGHLDPTAMISEASVEGPLCLALDLSIATDSSRLVAVFPLIAQAPPGFAFPMSGVSGRRARNHRSLLFEPAISISDW